MNKASKKVIYIAAFIGLLLGGYLLYIHLNPVMVPCGEGESMNCVQVNSSPYANLDGIFYLMHTYYQLPVPDVYLSGSPAMDIITSNAFLGMIMMVLIIALTWQEKLKWVRTLAVFSLIYGFYLLFIQHVVLEAYCIYCLMLDVVIITITIAAWSPKVRASVLE